MKRKVVLVLLIAIVSSTWVAGRAVPNAPSNHFKIWIFAGQSNMVGNFNQLQVSQLPSEFIDQQGISYFNGSPGVIGSRRARIVALAPLLQLDGTWSFGPELSFGKRMASTRPAEDLYIIKFAVNGTSLADNWLGTDTADLCPDAAQQSNCYEALLRTLEAAIEALGRGDTCEIEGFVWMQGESDASNPHFARNYLSNLQKFIGGSENFAGLRNDLKATDCEKSRNLKIFFGRIHPHFDWEFQEIVREAQAEALASKLAPDVDQYLIDTDRLSVAPGDEDPTQDADFMHFTGEGQLAFGLRLAVIAGEVVSVQRPPDPVGVRVEVEHRANRYLAHAITGLRNIILIRFRG